MINQIMNTFDEDTDNDNIDVSDINDKLRKEYQYTQSSLEATNFITSHSYENAHDAFASCLQIAIDMNDQFKINESNLNIAIVLAMLGKIKDAATRIENVYTSLKQLTSSMNLQQIFFKLKTMCNYVMILIAENKNKTALEVSNEIISIISHEVNRSRQVRYVKYVNYIIFRCESLTAQGVAVKKLSNEKGIYSETNSEELHRCIMTGLLNGFNEYLRNGNINKWIECLKVNGDKMKKVKDFNGLIFAIFNHEASVFMRETMNRNDTSVMSTNGRTHRTNNNALSNEAFEARVKLMSLLQAMNSDKAADEKGVDVLLRSFKDRMATAYQIYQLMLMNENKILSANTTNKDNSDVSIVSASNKYKTNTEFFIKILLKYAIGYIQNSIEDDALRIQLTNHLEQTIQLIKDKKLNVNDIRLDKLSPEISKSIHILFDNLLYIHDRCKKHNYITKYFKTVNRLKSFERDKKLKNFFDDHYLGIYNGDEIKKINMTSNGSINHFYQLDYDRDVLAIYKKQTSLNPEKFIEIGNIIKIMIGIRSVNLHRKLKQLIFIDEPWRYMSIILYNRSIDFLFYDEDVAKKWFYGLYHYLSNSKKLYKIMSCSGYLVQTMKMRMMTKMNLDPVNVTSMTFAQTLIKYSRTKKL